MVEVMRIYGVFDNEVCLNGIIKDMQRFFIPDVMEGVFKITVEGIEYTLKRSRKRLNEIGGKFYIPLYFKESPLDWEISWDFYTPKMIFPMIFLYHLSYITEFGDYYEEIYFDSSNI